MANRIELVAGILGLKLEQPFRATAFMGKYRLTRRGIEMWDGVDWFHSDLSGKVLEAILTNDSMLQPEAK